MKVRELVAALLELNQVDVVMPTSPGYFGHPAVFGSSNTLYRHPNLLPDTLRSRRRHVDDEVVTAIVIAPEGWAR